MFLGKCGSIVERWTHSQGKVVKNCSPVTWDRRGNVNQYKGNLWVHEELFFFKHALEIHKIMISYTCWSLAFQEILVKVHSIDIDNLLKKKMLISKTEQWQQIKSKVSHLNNFTYRPKLFEPSIWSQTIHWNETKRNDPEQSRRAIIIHKIRMTARFFRGATTIESVARFLQDNPDNRRHALNSHREYPYLGLAGSSPPRNSTRWLLWLCLCLFMNTGQACCFI